MNLSALRLIAITTGLATITPIQAWAGDAEVMQLLSSKQCRGCDLRRANLVHADLSGADLQGADLSGANLSQANLQGANLNQANLTAASLFGSDLSEATALEADFRGTDLREAYLESIRVSKGTLQYAHLEGARSIPTGVVDHATLHNQGVEEYGRGQYALAESKFSEAIKSAPDSIESWLSRGLSRAKLDNIEGAYADLTYAAKLAEMQGDLENSELIKKSAAITKSGLIGKSENKPLYRTASGIANALRMLAPLALKAVSRGIF